MTQETRSLYLRTVVPIICLVVCSSLPLLSACNRDTLVVPVRICVVQGTAFAPANSIVNMAKVTTQTHDIVARASKIWNDGADIVLLPYPDVRLIQDPTPTSSGVQNVGDILQDLGIAQGPSQESL